MRRGVYPYLPMAINAPRSIFFWGGGDHILLKSLILSFNIQQYELCALGCIKPPYNKTLQRPYAECVPFVITKHCVKYYEKYYKNIMIPRGST